MAVSDRLTDDEQQTFMESPDARDARRQAWLGELAVEVGQNFRGKRRVALFEGPEIPRPDHIPEVSVHQLRALLRASNRHGSPLAGEITKYPAFGVDHDKHTYNRYIEHANAADKVQSAFRVGKLTAEVRMAAIDSVLDSIKENVPFNRDATFFATDAIEDFGVCLKEEETVVKSMPNGTSMPRLLRHVGEYAAEDPEILRMQPDVLQLVQEEQARRLDYWSGWYEISLTEDRDRRTADDKLSDEHVAQLITSFGIHGAA